MAEIEMITIGCVTDKLEELRDKALADTGRDIDCVFMPRPVYEQLEREMEEKCRASHSGWRRLITFMGMAVWQSDCPDIKVVLKTRES